MCAYYKMCPADEGVLQDEIEAIRLYVCATYAAWRFIRSLVGIRIGILR